MSLFLYFTFNNDFINSSLSIILNFLLLLLLNDKSVQVTIHKQSLQFVYWISQNNKATITKETKMRITVKSIWNASRKLLWWQWAIYSICILCMIARHFLFSYLTSIHEMLSRERAIINKNTHHTHAPSIWFIYFVAKKKNQKKKNKEISFSCSHIVSYSI